MRWRITVTGLCLLVFCAGSRAEVIEGRDYVAIDAHAGADDERIEVIEFFYYGCRSCYLLEPVLQDWARRRATQIDFRIIPALRRSDWVPLSDFFFALHSLGLLPRLHDHVYVAIHEHGRRLSASSEQVRWIAEQGVDPDAFRSALSSDATLLATQQARDATIAYGIRVTPSIVVDGRFLTTGQMLGNASRVATVLDRLVEMAAQARDRAAR